MTMVDGSVPRARLMNALEVMADTCGYSYRAEGNSISLVKDGIPEVYDLPDPVGRRLIARIAHKYGIRSEVIYHPSFIQKSNKTEH